MFSVHFKSTFIFIFIQNTLNISIFLNFRLQKELMNLMLNGVAGISAFPESENFFKWIGTIHGPVGTVFEGNF